jgi:hypothetical protein
MVKINYCYGSDESDPYLPYGSGLIFRRDLSRPSNMDSPGSLNPGLSSLRKNS